MKPFLFLGTRAEDAAADSEFAAVLRCSGLSENDVRRHRLEAEPMPDVDLADFSGIICGGGPFNISDPPALKSEVQVRVEAEMQQLVDRVLATDFPFLGCCYGVGALGIREGGLVDRTYAEPIGPVRVRLTAAGREDQLLGCLPEEFEVFLGHKEAVSVLPRGAVNLAGSATCPVQAFRVGANAYATQFHPELDFEGIALRIEIYREYGYFEPSTAQDVIDRCARGVVTEPARILSRFVELFG